MRQQLLELAYGGTLASRPVESRDTYGYLAEQIGKSKHGGRFDTRDLDLDPLDDIRPSVLDIGYPLAVARDLPQEELVKLGNNLGKLVMPEEDWEAFVGAFIEIYADNEIKRHLLLGGSILVLSNHVTYADQPVENIASTLARIEQEVDEPQFSNVIVAHRITSLFRHDLIQTIHQLSGIEPGNGGVVDDVILPFGSTLQTLPRSNSGYTEFIKGVRNGKAVRKEITESVQLAFQRLLNIGGAIFMMAGSGQEAINGQEATVGKGTSEMIMSGNEIPGAERLLTIPLYIHSNPFTGDTKDPIHPTPTPFAFLKPRFIGSVNQVHRTMEEIMAAGNLFKPSGTPTISYNAPGPDWIHKDAEPEVIIGHSI